jgi:hypothetical protein
MAAAGESVAAIAKRLKRSSEAVRKRAHKLEIRLARSLPGLKAKGKWKRPPTEAALFFGFLIVLALRTLAQKAHTALSNPEPRLAVHLIPRQVGFLLSICGLTAIFVIVAHVLLRMAPATVQQLSDQATEMHNATKLIWLLGGGGSKLEIAIPQHDQVRRELATGFGGTRWIFNEAIPHRGETSSHAGSPRAPTMTDPKRR